MLLPLLLKLTVDVLSGTNRNWTVLQCASVYFAVIVLQSLLRLSYRYTLGILNARSAHELRTTYGSQLLLAPLAAVEGEKTGDLVGRISSDVDTVSGVFDMGIIMLIDAVFYLSAITVVMLVLCWPLALVALLPFPLVPRLVRRNDKRIRDGYSVAQKQLGKLSALAQEASAGVRVIKAFVAERAITSRFQALGSEYVASSIKLAKTEAVFGPSMELVMVSSLVLVLLVGGAWTIDGVITLGTFVAFQRYCQILLWPTQALGISIGLYQRARASSERLEQVIKLTPEHTGGIEQQRLLGAGAVELGGVSFAYPGTGRLVLRDISLKIPAGSTFAIVGPNGSGKTTLLALLARLYEVDSGKIFVGGLDVREWSLPKLREQFAFALQDLTIFSGTVAENIGFANSDGLSPDAIVRAAERAALQEEIERFPAAYETMLGERGINLSGGQRQRLTIARALAKQAPILVLDDIFSSVDSRTEGLIVRRLKEVAPEVTKIVVAQRLASVREADQIAVLSQGKIADIGTHAELFQINLWYRQFCEAQELSEQIEQFGAAV